MRCFPRPLIKRPKLPTETEPTTRTPETSSQISLKINRDNISSHHNSKYRSRSIELCCFLRQHVVDIAFIHETNVTTLNSIEDFFLGYRAKVVPALGARISGIFSFGVQVIYDPMGWLAPVIIIGKILIQKLWITRFN
ncbi:hypothetical protein LAZ67_2003156 [Cordylochernes scorpioides]|uniref:Uncharacterized protein n=1 Tax=Cordylochernes scorpioides TaxID=51811 RepID=A0ABY6K2I9_9ARAC|nr:hypothetical protein LAZ67_2003156 [Cordylochernes scorpioides]